MLRVSNWMLVRQDSMMWGGDVGRVLIGHVSLVGLVSKILFGFKMDVLVRQP